MKVLSLFDGISCGRVALERAGIKVDRYVSYEIDKNAIMVSQYNWDDIEYRGSVVGADFTEFVGFDLVIGGSPCQGFSFAGKQLNFDDPRSKLFFEFVRAVKEVNPRYFMLENVVMKKEYQDVISDYLGVQPIKINSALVSAQNRKRLYWTNIPYVGQPEDKGILLQTILERGLVDRDKSLTVISSYAKNGATLNQLAKYINGKYGMQLVFTERRTEEAKRARKEYMRIHGKDFSPRRDKELVPREDNKCNCLTTTLSNEHILLDEKLNFRKLTPIECERLQTLPDGYTEIISNTARYHALGNGWTVDVIAHILEYINIADNI